MYEVNLNFGVNLGFVEAKKFEFLGYLMEMS